jgi:hypothetical protein
VQIFGTSDHFITTLDVMCRQSDIDLHHLRRIGLVAAEDRKFYVRAFVDPHESKFTTPEKPHSLPWTENLELCVTSPR